MQHVETTTRFGKSRYVLLLLLILLTGGCRDEDTSWERISASGVLRVGLDPTYPPFEVADADGVRGLDVDLAQAIAAELGLTAEFVYFGYDGLYDALLTGQVDVLISALVVAPERTRDFAYSAPYFNAGEILLAPEEETAIRGMADLDGRILAIELGARGHVEAMQWTKRLRSLTLLPRGSAEAALTAVVNGEADAALVDAVSGRLFLADQPADQPVRLKRLPDPITVEPYAVVVRRDNRLLLERLDAALAALRASGMLNDIIARWLGA
jgi:ABC-type amino acid transport substrate-binding protein